MFQLVKPSFKSLKVNSLITICLTLIFVTPKANAFSPEELQSITRSSYKLIGLAEAQRSGFTGKGQVVVFIDDGTDASHPYIKEAMLDGFCSSESACGEDFLKSGLTAGGIKPIGSNSTHGLMVAGIIAGKPNEFAPGGIAPEAKLISITNTNGNLEGLIAAFDWVLEAKKKYNIVALSGSFGSTNISDRSDLTGCSAGSSILDRKIKAIGEAGIIPIFAAGNDGNPMKISYPACLPYVVSVGALTLNGFLQPYTNVGAGLTVLAPSDVMSASNTPGYFMGGGTSAAAPVVAGAVALLKQAKPEATFNEIVKALQTTSTHLDDSYWQNIPALHLPSALTAIQSGKFNPIEITSVSSQISTNSSSDKLLLEAAIKDKRKAESDLKSAADMLSKAESELKSTLEANKTLSEELSNLKSQLIVKLGEISNLTEKLRLLDTESTNTKKKLNKVCKAKPKPKGC